MIIAGRNYFLPDSIRGGFATHENLNCWFDLAFLSGEQSCGCTFLDLAFGNGLDLSLVVVGKRLKYGRNLQRKEAARAAIRIASAR